MIRALTPGERVTFRRVIRPEDAAAFEGEVVHPVYSTFALARDAEWTARQFVLQCRGEDEEGVGTRVEVQHHGPAFPGEEIIFTATVDSMDAGELICSFEARIGDRLIATGRTGQRILPRARIRRLFTRPDRK